MTDAELYARDFLEKITPNSFGLESVVGMKLELFMMRFVDDHKADFLDLLQKDLVKAALKLFVGLR
jgi:DNA-binding ferritin-like protein (Dps family)